MNTYVATKKPIQTPQMLINVADMTVYGSVMASLTIPLPTLPRLPRGRDGESKMIIRLRGCWPDDSMLLALKKELDTQNGPLNAWEMLGFLKKKIKLQRHVILVVGFRRLICY